MSYYADYLRERTDDEIVETQAGFASYRFLNKDQCYIIDIYVVPEMRKNGAASQLASEIITIAKARGCTQLIGTVCVTAKNSDISLKVLQAYGMTLKSAQNEVIILKKDI